jgi:hypothetical protein
MGPEFQSNSTYEFDIRIRTRHFDVTSPKKIWGPRGNGRAGSAAREVGSVEPRDSTLRPRLPALPPATASATASRGTCSRPGATSAPSKSCSATATSPAPSSKPRPQPRPFAVRSPLGPTTPERSIISLERPAFEQSNQGKNCPSVIEVARLSCRGGAAEIQVGRAADTSSHRSHVFS